MDDRSHSEQRLDRVWIKDWALGVLLSWDPDPFEHMPGEEWLTALVLLASPVQRGLEHHEVTPNGVGSDNTTRHATVPPPHHVLVNPIRGQLANWLVESKEPGQIATSLTDMV